MKLAFRSVLLAAFALAAVPAFAHHSFSMFSMDTNATYKGNDGRLYFGAFAPAAGNTADLYSTHLDGEDLRQLSDSGPTRHDICPALSADARAARCCNRD